MGRYLTIIEVSQKQAYIFAVNKLKENIRRSYEIAYITSPVYMQKAVDESAEKVNVERQLVYTGGGHTILEFSSKEEAYALVKSLTKKVLKEVPEIELFAKTVSYDENRSPGENVKVLTATLEKKKSIRRESFHQETFGIEAVDVNTGKPKQVRECKLKLPNESEEIPGGYTAVTEFEKLGNTKDKRSFIAVVHIDGNSMGKRVEALTESCKDWNEYKCRMRSFSEAIANDFMASYQEMQRMVANNITTHHLDDLDLQDEDESLRFPVRRVICEGDDICFVSEGRIGIECAVAFLKALSRKVNKEDGNTYSACAGVALVHQKYPFYRAYELAEKLCRNAKYFGASLGTDGTSQGISAIDWHIEYGELQDSLEDSRRAYYTRDGKRLELRPYIVTASQEFLEKEKIRQYRNFKKLITRMEDCREAYGRSRLKTLRHVLKQGSASAEHYLTFHKIESLKRSVYQDIYVDVDYENFKIGSGEGLEGMIFTKTNDGVDRCLLFDVIEMMDTYLGLEDDS